MGMKDDLCAAFCGTLTVNKVPAGYAVGTDYAGFGGDQIGFYIEKQSDGDFFRIVDNALSIPTLESLGADIEKNATRRETFLSLLEEYGVSFDDKTGELHTGIVSKNQVPATAMQFLAFMLRVQDLAFMSAERAESTFREDAMARIKAIAKGKAEIVDEEFYVSDKLHEIPADFGIRVKDTTPVAVFFGVSDNKLNEAMLLQAWAVNAGIPCAVVALIENEKKVSAKVRQRASNHLDATPIYQGDEQAACLRVVQEALGREFTGRAH